MNRILSSILCSFLFVTASTAQNKQFDTLFHKMFFNIFLHKPDSTVLNFVETYFPNLAKPRVESKLSAITIYSPIYIDSFPEPQETEHSLLFTRHPFFNISFTKGKLEILTTEAKGFLPRIQTCKIIFSFKNKADADKALNYFIGVFTPVSKSKTIQSANGKTTVVFSDGDIIPLPVCFSLYKDEQTAAGYKLSFGHKLD